MSLISTIEHAFAVGAQKVVAEAKVIELKVLPFLVEVKASEATVEGVTALVAPAAVNIERSAYAVLGVAIKAIEDAATAAAAGGVNLTLDAVLVADLKSIIPAVKSAAPSVAPAVPAVK